MLSRITLGLLILGRVLAAGEPLTFATQSPLQPATTNLNYTTTFTAAGGSGTYTFTATGLPSWLTLGPKGILSGVPPAPGPVTFTVTVTDTSSNSASQAFTLPVNSLLAIATSSPLQPATLGVASSYTLMATGGTGGYTWSSTCLPTWLTLDPSGTLSISSTPPSAGTYTFALTVTDSSNNTSSKLFTLVVDSALTIVTPPAIPAATAGVPYSFKFVAAGGSGDFSGYSWSASGLPEGFSLSPTGVLTGESSTAGPISFVVTLTDPASESETQKNFVLAVNSQLTISFRAPIGVGSMRAGKELVLPTATDGELYTGSFLVSGGTGPFTWSATGLPSWFILAPTGFLTGTPPDGTTSASFTVTVTDSTSKTASLTVTLSVNPPLLGIIPVVSSDGPPALLPEAVVGVPYSIYFCLPGSQGLSTWSASPPLPTWLTLPPGPSSTAQLSGTPPASGTVTFTVTASPNSGPPTSGTFTLPIESAPVITDAPTPAIVGAPYTFQFTASGGSGTYSWSAAGLPTWLALSASGALMGTPPTQGPVSFTATVTDSLGATTTGSFTLQVNAALQISPTSLPAATAGTLYSVQFMGTGGTGSYTWTATGLPTWLTLSTSGLLTGTPPTPATVTFSVTLTDSANDTTTSAFTLTVEPVQGNGLTITTTSPLPSGTVGTLYSLQFAATGGTGPYTWTATGLPSWLGLSTGGTLIGTPPTPGTLTFTVTVTDSQENSASSTFTLVVNAAQGAPLAITTTSPLPAATVGLLYTLQFAAIGGTSPYTWTASGLPTWLSLSTGGSLKGTPPATGPITFTVTVTDSAQHTISTTFVLPVNPTQGSPLTISTTSPVPNATVGAFYSLQFAATGGTGPYTWTASGLPSWLALTAGGSLLGTPPTAGTLTFTVTVNDTEENSASATFTLLVNPVTTPLLTITTTSPLPAGIVGTPYSLQFAAAGGTGTYTWTASGLPTWLTLSNGGLLTGTPPTTGTLMFTVTVSDPSNDVATATFVLPVNPVTSAPLAITTTSPLPAATALTFYSLQFAATGGTGPYTWTAVGLPGWLGLSSGGALMGTPPTSGIAIFTVTVTDAQYNTASGTFMLTANPAQQAPLSIITTSPLPSATVGTLYSLQFAATGGTGTYTWTATGLPAWLGLSTGGTLIGTPPATGTVSFNVTVTDSANDAATNTFTLEVNYAQDAPLAITTTSPLPAATVGLLYTLQFAAIGGTSPYNWTASGLPTWLSLSTSGSLTGTPPAMGPITFTVTVTDSAQHTISTTFVLPVNPAQGAPLTISTTSPLPNATVGAFYSLQFAATGGTSPYTWTASELPSWLALTAGGSLLGTPPVTGTFSFNVTVTDTANNTATGIFTLMVNPATTTPLTITTTSPLPPATVGVPYSLQFAAAGGTGTYTWSASGLPTWLTLSNSGLLTGTPPNAGTLMFTVTVSDPSNDVATATFVLPVNPVTTTPLSITTTSPLPAGIVGTPYSLQFAATGGTGSYTWTGTKLPAWLTLSTGGILTGTPPATGTFSFNVTVTDTANDIATGIFVLTVNPVTTTPLSITTTSPLPAGIVGSPYSLQFAATGGTGSYTWTGTKLPAWLTLSTGGILTGTPPATGTFSFNVTVTDTANDIATGIFTLTVNPVTITPLSITTTSPLPAGIVGSPYSLQFTATGGTGSYTWTATKLPTWLTLSTGGILAGTPPATGTFSFNVTVTDSANDIATGIFTLTVNPAQLIPLTITTTSPLPAATVGTPHSLQFAATGGTGPYTWTATGLPAWLTLSTGGALTGTPPVTGTLTFNVTVTDSANNTVTDTFMLPVKSTAGIPPLAITTTSPLPSATVGIADSLQFAATGGTGPYTWTATGLPTWLSLSTNGLLTGTPPAAGPVTFNVTVTDSAKNTLTNTFVLPVNPTQVTTPLAITTASPLPAAIVGIVDSLQFAATGGTAPYTWTATGLPAKFSLSSSGLLLGTPAATGTLTFTVSVTDSANTTVTQTFQLPVNTAQFAQLTITTTSPLPVATAGTLYSLQFMASGGYGSYNWTATGLPTWLSLSNSGLLIGTPPTSETLQFTVAVNDADEGYASNTFSLTVDPSRVAPLTITTTSPLPAATVGTPYSLQFAASGGSGGNNWTASGLPTWLSLSTSGLLTGTPPASAMLQFSITVNDSDEGTASNTFSLTVNPATAPLTISTASPLPAATVDVPYSQQFTATGGTAGYLWTATGLPTWLTLSTSGLLTGTPPITGSLQFTVTVTDSSTQTASKTFSLSVAAPVLPLTITTNSPLPEATKGVFYSATFTAANGRGSYTWTAVGLPSGLTLSTAGVLSGTPTVAGLFSPTVTVADDSQATASKTFSLAVLSTGAPLQFASSALPACTVDSICNAAISATGGVPPYSFSLNQTQVIGDNLTLSPEGLISGLPTQAELLSFSVQVTDAARTTIFQTFRLQVNGTNLTITSTSLPSGTVNTPYSATLAATGGTTYSWTIVSGSLPPGLTLNASSGAITGTPTAAGTSTFSAEVASGNLVSAPQTFTITITGTQQLTITSPLQLPPANLGASYSQNLSATGGSGGYTWTTTAGSLPAGLTLAPSGAISGTPTMAQTATFTATVTDSSGATASAQFSLMVTNPLVPSILTSSPLPDAVVNQPYNYPVSVSGGIAPYTWSITQGMIPDGLTFSSLTGTFSGTPTTIGSFTFTLTVLDSTSPRSLQTTQTYTIQVLALTDFHITSASMLPNGTLNLAYQQSLTATGGTPPYTWQLVNGSWPAGINLDSTGNLSGTPTTSGTYAEVVQATDSTGAVATAAFSLTIANPKAPTVAINPAPGPAIVNTPYMHTFTAGGGAGPYTWTVVMGSLPPGLTLNPSTGVLSGTPTQKGNYPITVQVTDANGTVSTQQFTIAVLNNDLTITPAALPVASLNVPYSFTLTAAGGTAPYTWSLTTGSLVAGFTLNPVTGVLSGTPTQAGTLTFDISVSDQSNDQSSQSFSLTVGSTMLTISTTQTKQTAMVGAAYSFTFAAAQGDTPYTWSVSAGTLPPGLTLNSKTGVLAGTPTTAGTYSFTLQVADATGGTAQVAVSIVVSPAALAISTGSTLPAGVAGTAYSTRLQSTGGSGPITWSAGGGTPPGLSLASSTGVLSGTPLMAGDFKFTVSATDSTGAVVSQTVSLTIAAPAAVLATAAGLPATVNPGDQPTVTLTLAAPYPLPITVTATLQLSPSLGGTSDLLFPNGSTTMQFTIPANTTQSSFTFQAGTVAGTIQLSLAYEAAGVDITPSSSAVLSTQIVAAAPVIKSVVATQTMSGIQVVIDGLSTTRDMKSATFQFTPASGATLQTTSVTVDVSAMFAAWYQSASSLPLGSQFSLTIPFTVNGNVNTIASLSVTLTNSVGTSAAVSATVP